ncbi:enoyl-CoA hydratase/carnithine racemase [Bradyrhizobium sp. i1.3.1]
MAYKNFRVETDSDGIALVTWDIPGRSMNVLDETSTSELDAIVKETTADAAVKGVVITSAKEAFCAGADLSMLEGMNQAYAKVLKEQDETAANQMLFDQSRRFSQVLRSIETSGKPWAAAINGLALGGGFEITLCCPLPRRGGKSQDAPRPARGQGRPVPRRRRHAARAAPGAAAGRDDDPAQGRSGHGREGQGA